MDANLLTLSDFSPLQSKAESSFTLPWVIVPVLSEHITVIEPKFSMAFNFFTITPCSDILLAPCDKFTLIIAGSIWGVNPTERANANIKDSKKDLFRIILNKNIIPINKVVTWSIRLPKSLMPFSKSVSESFLFKDKVIFPNSESLARFTITAIPDPLMT